MKSPMIIENMNDLNQHFMLFKITFIDPKILSAFHSFSVQLRIFVKHPLDSGEGYYTHQ